MKHINLIIFGFGQLTSVFSQAKKPAWKHWAVFPNIPSMKIDFYQLPDVEVKIGRLSLTWTLLASICSWYWKNMPSLEAWSSIWHSHPLNLAWSQHAFQYLEMMMTGHFLIFNFIPITPLGWSLLNCRRLVVTKTFKKNCSSNYKKKHR